MYECDRIILELLARVGDRVVFNADTKSESWHYKTQEQRGWQGKTGRLFGFTMYEDYVPRFGRMGRKPGVYMRRGAAVVRWDDGSGGTVSMHDLSWWPWSESDDVPVGAAAAGKAIAEHNAKMGKRRQAERPKSMDTEDEIGRVFLRELPELQFCELDVVRTKQGEELIVCSINWQYFGERRENGSFMPMLELRHPVEGYTRSAGIDDVRLIRRGNVWRWFSGRREEMVFGSTEEEAAFYRGLGRCRSVPNAEGKYSYSLEEAVAAVRRGDADCLGVAGGMFGSARRTEVYKFEDEGPARRIREKTLAGFAEMAS